VSDASQPNRLGEIARVFLRLGVIGFGGPAVTIAMMEDETVTRRKWLDRDRFLDLVGLTNIIPGPNAAELAIHLGHVRGGLAGLFVAGAAFILPGMFCSLLLGWFYVRYGALPAVAPVLQGVKPAVLAALIVAVGRLGQRAVKGWRLALLGLAVAAVSLLGIDEVITLFGGGFLGMAWLLLARRQTAKPKATSDAPPSQRPPDDAPQRRPAWLLPLGPGLALASWAAAAAAPLWQLGLFFLKVGAVLYGTGYVLIAFLEGGLVRDLGWLTQQQLLDAIAAGQLTPGPLLSTATFVGYVVRGYPGAAVATLGAFAPSFIIVFILTLAVPRIRRSPALAAFLDAINVCSIALMVSVGVKLAIASVQSWQAAVIALLSAVIALRWKVNSAWLVLGGALAGGLLDLLRLW
jgi:chromate transporter